MDRKTLLQEIARYKFYQTIDLGDGVTTPGRPLARKQELVLETICSMSLEGKRVLDLGCANGLFALAAEKQGADEVVAVDHTPQNIESLQRVILPTLNSNVKPRLENLLSVSSKEYGKFDLIVFAGLLYHLRYPFWALRIVRDLLCDRGRLILETPILEDFNRAALMYCPSPADSPQSSRHANACSYFNEKALSETLAYFGIRVESKRYATKPLRRLAKKVAGTIPSSYCPRTNVVLYCEQDSSLENESLTQFYESTTE